MILLAGIGLIADAPAQEVRKPEVVPEEGTPDVRRPEVVEDDEPRTVPAVPATPPARPAANPTPRPTPTPAPATNTEPARPAPAPAPRTPTGPREEWDDLYQLALTHLQKGSADLAIRSFEEYTRLAPKGRHAEEARFRIGEAHYGRKAWDMAVTAYDIYLNEFPAGKNLGAALYHKAESHREMAMQNTRSVEERGQHQLASFDSYRNILKTTKQGTWACFSAFRLASAAYNEGVRSDSQAKYAEAIPLFTTAATLAATPGNMTPKQSAEVRLGSLYWRGKCQRLTGKKKEAAASFDDVVKIREENKYREDALKELAALDWEAGRADKAMERFDMLAKETANAETKADALVSAGLLDAEKGKDVEADQRFEAALKVPGARNAHSRARYGLIFSAAKKKDNKRVIELWRDLGDYSSLDSATRSRMLLIVGQAFLDEQNFAQAERVFAILEENHAGTDEALDGGYKRLVCLFKLNSGNVSDAVDTFVSTWKEKKKDSPLIDRALLAKAGYFYNKSAWEVAAKAYAGVRLDKLEPAKAADCLYQRGWAETEAGDNDAITTLTTFLEKHNSDPRVPHAVFQRGRACMKADDLTSALRDFDRIRAMPVPAERAESISWENAIFLSARIRGSRQEWDLMVKEFTELLTKFPGTAYVAEANYWIGSGHYQMKRYKESLEPLRKARELDAKTWQEEAGLQLIGATASIKDVDGCAKEAEAYERLNPKKKIPVQVMEWIAITLFKERKDYRGAARFLFPIMNWEDSKANDPDLWSVMGESLLRSARHDEAVKAFDNQLANDTRKPNRSKAYLMRGEALLALNKPEEAIESARSGLELDAETFNAARLRMLWADAALAVGRIQEAISAVAPVPDTWKNEEITPLALHKLITLLEKSTDPKHQAQLPALRQQLSKEYPDWKPAAASGTARATPDAPR